MNIPSIGPGAVPIAPAPSLPAGSQAPALFTPLSVHSEGLESPVFVDERQLEKAVTDLNKELAVSETNLRFSVHKETRQILVKIVDTNTQEVLKEIPPEKILNMVAYMMKQAGLILDHRG